MKPLAHKLSLSIQFAVEAKDHPTRTQLRRWARAALRTNCTVTLRIVDEAEGTQLNHHYRQKNYATNVLTFVYEPQPNVSGDIALCAPVIEREALDQDVSRDAHWAHLVVHGMLHLQGYDHERRADAKIMERLETEIVTQLGYADPYRVTA